MAEVAEGTAVKESLAEQNNRIRVYVRKRPMNSRGGHLLLTET